MTKAEVIQAANLLAAFDRLIRARNAALRPSAGVLEIISGLSEHTEIQKRVVSQVRAFVIAALDEQEAKMRRQLAALGVVEEDKPASNDLA